MILIGRDKAKARNVIMRTYADELGRWSDGWWTCPPSKKGT
ncbi:MAG: hypothetical protein ACLUW6_07135 [Coriobacteriaceae bacterium]